MKQIPLSCSVFLVLLIAAPILWLADVLERAYWHRYAKLRMGATDGYHVYIDGRCRTI